VIPPEDRPESAIPKTDDEVEEEDDGKKKKKGGKKAKAGEGDDEVKKPARGKKAAKKVSPTSVWKARQSLLMLRYRTLRRRKMRTSRQRAPARGNRLLSER